MVQKVNVLASKSDNLSSIPRTHIVELILAFCLLILQVYHGKNIYTN